MRAIAYSKTPNIARRTPFGRLFGLVQPSFERSVPVLALLPRTLFDPSSIRNATEDRRRKERELKGKSMLGCSSGVGGSAVGKLECQRTWAWALRVTIMRHVKNTCQVSIRRGGAPRSPSCIQPVTSSARAAKSRATQRTERSAAKSLPGNRVKCGGSDVPRPCSETVLDGNGGSFQPVACLDNPPTGCTAPK